MIKELHTNTPAGTGLESDASWAILRLSPRSRCSVLPLPFNTFERTTTVNAGL